MSGNTQLLAAAVWKLVRDQQAQGASVVTPDSGANQPRNGLPPWLAGFIGGDMPGVNEVQQVTAVGDGTAKNGFFFSPQAGGFNPNKLHMGAQLLHSETGTPNRPRAFTATPTYSSGLPDERIDVVLEWYAPLVDTVGRWLIQMNVDDGTGSLTTQDLVSTYLIRRQDMGTGEETVVAVVAHSNQYISALRSYLESEYAAGRAGANTDPLTLITTIDPSFDVNVTDSHGTVLYTEPFVPGHENAFTFVDHTAIYGRNYTYQIQAITAGQEESAIATAIPGAATAASGLDISPSGSWCTSFPTVDAGVTSPTEAYLDFAFSAGALTTDIEMVLVPIQDDVVAIDTSWSPDTAPQILQTDPLEAKLYAPATGTSTQTLHFLGRNLELHGGISSIDLGAGITFTPSPTTLVKTQVGSTNDWIYAVQVVVASTAAAGIKTMTVTCGDASTAACSTITLSATPAVTGPIWDQAGTTVRLDLLNRSFYLTGKNLDKMTGISTDSGAFPATISEQTANKVLVTIGGVLPVVGLTLTAQLAIGVTSTGKDSCKVMVSVLRGPHNPNFPNSADPAYRLIPTLSGS